MRGQAAQELIRIVERNGACTLPVKVRPRASQDAVTGVLDGRLAVSLRAVPEQGRANDALLDFLGEELGVPRRALSLAQGHSHPRKLVTVALAAAALRTRLARLLDPARG